MVKCDIIKYKGEMSTFEEELIRILPVIRRLRKISLLGKKIILEGEENLIKRGPNLIVGNHIGSYKDITVLFEIMPRTIFFTANRMIFNKKEFNFLIKKHLRRHLKDLGVFFYRLFTPLRIYFVKFISTNIIGVGTIPVDLEGSKKRAIIKCQEYVESGKAVVLLQGTGRIIESNPNPYVSAFRRGPSIISYNLFKEKGISVPVTPIAMFGTHLPFLIPMKIKVSVGKPMFIKDYMTDNFDESVIRFRNAMEKRVQMLLYELVKPSVSVRT